MTINSRQETQKISEFIKNIFLSTKKSTAIIGLSGGIDSATSFALTCRALGPEHIQAFHLPSKTTNPQHLKDIQLLTSKLKLPAANLHIISIDSIIQKSWRIIKKYCDSGLQSEHAQPDAFRQPSMRDCKPDEQTNKLRLANLSARIRMMILFDAAKKYDGLVIGTENKSENMLGYFTRFGDSASDLEPIAHLFKTQVIEMAKYLEIPEAFIKKSPSADLWPGQTDETELGFSYAEADPILEQISLDKNPTGNLADKIKTIVTKSAFKHQVPYLLDK